MGWLEMNSVHVCGRADVWGLGWQLHVVVRWGLGTVQLSEYFHSIHHLFSFFRKGRGREKTKVGRNGRESPVYSLTIFRVCIAPLFLSLPVYLQCIHCTFLL